MSPDQTAALGAFLSGVGSVVGGWWVVRSVRKKAEHVADRRIAELRDEYERGMKEGLKLEERGE